MLESTLWTSELRRLEDGPGPEEQIPGIGTITFALRCDGNAKEILHNIVAVLKAVISESENGWSEETDWRSILPKPFVASCADEMTPSEAEEWLQRWQALSQEERDAEDRDRKWSLANWLYWMKPSERQWQWWDSNIFDASHLVVRIAVNSWPFGCGAITWLFRAAGARMVTVLNPP